MEYYPKDGYIFDTQTEIQKEFIRRITEDGIDAALTWLEPVKAETECSYPAELKLEWKKAEGGLSVVEIAKEPSFQQPFVIRTMEASCRLTNLEIGTRYYWRVNGGEVHTFTTCGQSPRFIRIDGLLNVRDLGGNRIRQGMLYRGSEMDRTFTITETGKVTFCEQLGIRTELDLRGDWLGKISASPAGENVQLVQLPYRPYKEVFEEQHRKGICQIMEFLADERHYPIYFHCMGGADRTGMIALYLRALLGESDEEIHLDYELTALSMYAAGAAEGANGFRRRNSSYYMEFLQMLDAYAPGEPLRVQVRAFLRSCGVTDKVMERVARILRKSEKSE